MKKILLLLILIVTGMGVNAQCDYTINGADSWGDGWNGGSIDVSVNGVVTNFTFATGFSATISIPSYTGDNVTFTWNSGNFDAEVTFDILAPDGTNIGSYGPSPSSGLFLTNTSNSTCAAPSCLDPNSLSTSNILNTSADLNWTAPMGAVSYNWEVQPSGVAQGTAGALASGTGLMATTVNTGSTLTQNTTYDFYVQSYCGGTDSSNWVSASFTTTQPGTTCGNSLAVSSVPYTDAGMTTAGFGDNISTSACSNNYITGDEKVYTYTPATNQMVDVKFTNITDNYSGIHITDNCPDAAGAVCLGQATNGFSTIDLEVLNISLVAGFTYYFTISTFTAPQTTGGDFSITLSPTCSKPINQAVSNITSSSAEFDWDNGTAGSPTQWLVEYGASGFAPGSGTVVSVSTFDSLLVTGLSSFTTYDWYVSSVCSTTDTSEQAGPNTFTTLNSPPNPPSGITCTTSGANQTLIFHDDFEDGFASWTGDVGGSGPFGTGAEWNTNSGTTGSGSTGPAGAFSGTEYIYFEGSTSGTASAVSTAIDLTNALDDAELSFMMHAYGSDMGTFSLGVGTSATGPFATEFTFSGPLQTSSADAWVPVGVDLSSYVGSTIYIQLLNTTTTTFAADFSIDSFSVYACATCNTPSNATTTQITTNSAHLDWTTGGTPLTFWTVEYGPAGFTPGTGTTLTPGMNLGVGSGNDSARLSGLTSATDYEWYVADICNAGNPGDTSAYLGPIAFSTLSDYCGGDHFYDNGGATGNYANNSNDTTTIFPSNSGDVVTVTFNTFNTEAGFDDLTIYDGPNTSSTSIGTFDGTAIPGPFTSTHASGALTFVFDSDNFVNRPGWDATITCAAPPTCFQATNLIVNSITSTSAAVSWTPGDTATSHFILEYDTAGFTQGTGNFLVVTDTFTTISGLTAETNYDWYVRDSCGAGDVGPWSSVSSFYTGYCIPTYTNGTSFGDLISNVEIVGTTLANNTGTTNGTPSYTYYTGMPNFTADLQAGTSYDVEVTVGSFGNQNIAAWIDFNDDLVFDASEKIGFTTSSINGNGTATFTISLPCNPSTGVHRMRIRDVYVTSGNAIDPCINYTYGETEDYDVTVLAPPPCPQISALANFGTITSTTASFNWTPGCTETAWDYEVNTSATAPTGTPANVMHTDTFVIATGLMAETTYYAHVRANCGGGNGVSGWSTISFTTLPTPPSNDDCDNATSLTVNTDLACGSTTSGTIIGATASSQADDVTGTPDTDVWYSFVATNTAHQISLLNVVNTGGSGFPATSTDMGMGVYDMTAGCASLVFFDDSDPNTLDLSGLTVGTTYAVRVYGWFAGAQNNNFDICVGTPPPPPLNDSIGGAIALSCGDIATASTSYATSDAAIGTCAGGGTGGSPGIGVWYSFVGTGEDIQVSLCGSNFDTELHIYSGPNADTCIISNDDGALCTVTSRSSATFTSVSGVQYYFLASGFGTSTGNVEISVTCIPVGAITWLGGSTNYNTPSNWSGGAVPTCADDIFIPLTANNPTITGPFECNNFGTAASVNPLISLAGSLGICGNVDLSNATVISGTGIVKLNGTNTSGSGTFNVNGTATIERISVESNYSATGGLDINNSIVMNGGNFNATAATVTLKSTATSTAYLDDFTNATGTYSGNITVERFVTNGSGLGQRYFGSAVASGVINGLDDTYAGAYPLGQIIPDVCNVSLMSSSPYSNMFEWHEDASFASGCEQEGWYAISDTSVMEDIRGYSGWMNDGTVLTVTGAPNTGSMSYATSGASGSNQANADGWHLFTNPYPSPMLVDAFINSGFTSPQSYNGASGPYNGTYNPMLVTGGELAIMQGFFAEYTGSGTPTVMTDNTSRVASNTTTWYSTSNLFNQMLTINVNGNGFADRTFIYYVDDNFVTANFDDYTDSKKRNSDFGQPTIYSSLNNERMSLNGFPTSSLGQSIPFGVDHGTDGNFTLAFEGLDDFAANTTVYVEDKQLGIYHNIENGNYSYTALATDNSDRFELHFVLPVEFATTNVSCTGEQGSLEIASSNDIADRNFELFSNNNSLNSGALSNLNTSLDEGIYTVLVNDAFGGNQEYTVTIEADETIEAAYEVSSTDVQVGELVSFNNLTTNATDFSWEIVGHTTISGVSNATYTFDEAGVYDVILHVQNEDCSAAEHIQVRVSNKTTSINTIDESNEVVVFADQNTIVLEFENTLDSDAFVTVRNVLGQIVFEGSVVSDGQQKIEMENVSSTYYFVTVSLKEKSLTKKLFLSK